MEIDDFSQTRNLGQGFCFPILIGHNFRFQDFCMELHPKYVTTVEPHL